MAASTARHEGLSLLDGAGGIADEFSTVVAFLRCGHEVGSLVKKVVKGERGGAAVPGREGGAVEGVPAGAVGGEGDGGECFLEGLEGSWS